MCKWRKKWMTCHMTVDKKIIFPFASQKIVYNKISIVNPMNEVSIEWNENEYFHRKCTKENEHIERKNVFMNGNTALIIITMGLILT